MLEKISLLPGWSQWKGSLSKGTAFRKVFEQLTGSRQLVGYLVHLPSADTTIFSLNVDENGRHFANVTSFQCSGLGRHDLRVAYAESCFRSFRSLTEPEAVTLAGVA